MAKLSTVARLELVEAVAERYRKGSTDEKGRILDEFVALTGTTASMRFGCLESGSLERRGTQGKVALGCTTRLSGKP